MQNYEMALEILLKSKGFEISKKGKIKEISFKELIAATTYVYITYIGYWETTRKGMELYVNYQSEDGTTVIDTFDVIVPFNQKVRLSNFNEIFANIAPTIEKGYLLKFQEIYKEYFTSCIQNEILYNPALTMKCGWFHNENEWVFKAVNYRNDNTSAPSEKIHHPLIETCMFNGLLKSDFMKKCTLDTYLAQPNKYEELFSLLISDGNALLIFSYCIHAILWNYSRGYHKFRCEDMPNTDNVLFSLCIYGKNIPLAKTVANLLVNVFDIHRDSWSQIKRTFHISSTSLNKNKFYALEAYRSVPIIVTSKSNHFYKSSSILKEIQDKREHEIFHIFPVYISQSPVEVDEMINCCTDEISLDIKNKELLYALHRDMCFLLYSYIRYLTLIQDQNKHLDRTDYAFIADRIPTEYEHMKSQGDFADTHMPEFLLFTSLQCFCYYLSLTPLKKYARQLYSTYVETVMQSDKRPAQSDSAADTDYIQSLVSFLNSKIKQPSNTSWLFEGKEARDDKEDCYYLSAARGYKYFSAFIKKQNLPYISKTRFLKLLENNGILKLPKTGSSKSFKRREGYFYVLKKESLNPFQ